MTRMILSLLASGLLLTVSVDGRAADGGALTGPPSGIQAKRRGPAEVPPVVKSGVRYEVPHTVMKDGKPEPGGFVRAVDVKSGNPLWERQVYRIKTDPKLETDVQWVFINQLRVRGKKLVIQNEHKERFEMDIASGKVRALSKLGPNTEVAEAPTAHR